jgi:uncharacterized membrane protein YphA (DoxX/SURF4 family)
MAMFMAEKKAKWMKTAKVIYWIVTLLFVSAIGSGGVMMLIGNPENVKGITDLGYPAYLCTILGVAKILGSIAILFGGKFRTLKEWAYAGISFDLLGASASYALHGGTLLHMIAPLVLLVFVLISHRQWKTGWM